MSLQDPNSPRILPPMPSVEPEQARPNDPGLLRRVANFFVAKGVEADLGESPKTLLGEHSLKEGRGLPVMPITAMPRHNRIPKFDLIIEDVAPYDGRPANVNNTNWPWGTPSKHDAILRVIPDAKHHHKFYLRKQAEGVVNRLASPDRKRDVQYEAELKYAQRVIYGRITNLPVMTDGSIGELQSRHTEAQWVGALNPHNIARFKEMYVSKMVRQAVGSAKEDRADIPTAHLNSGNVTILDPATMAAYFGVSVEDWTKQMQGEGNVVPQNVLIAMGHYLSISDSNLKSVCESIENPTDTTMLSRAKNAPRYVAPEVINPHGAPNMDDVVYINKVVGERMSEELKKAGSKGKVLPRNDYQALTMSVRRKVIEEYLGADATDEDIDRLSRAVRMKRLMG